MADDKSKSPAGSASPQRPVAPPRHAQQSTQVAKPLPPVLARLATQQQQQQQQDKLPLNEKPPPLARPGTQQQQPDKSGPTATTVTTTPSSNAGTPSKPPALARPGTTAAPATATTTTTPQPAVVPAMTRPATAQPTGGAGTGASAGGGAAQDKPTMIRPAQLGTPVVAKPRGITGSDPYSVFAYEEKPVVNKQSSEANRPVKPESNAGSKPERATSPPPRQITQSKLPERPTSPKPTTPTPAATTETSSSSATTTTAAATDTVTKPPKIRRDKASGDHTHLLITTTTSIDPIPLPPTPSVSTSAATATTATTPTTTATTTTAAANATTPAKPPKIRRDQTSGDHQALPSATPSAASASSSEPAASGSSSPSSASSATAASATGPPARPPRLGHRSKESSGDASNSPTTTNEVAPMTPKNGRELACFSEDDEDAPPGDFDEDLIELEIAPNPIPKYIRLGMSEGRFVKQGWLSKSSYKGQPGTTFLGRNLDLWKKRFVILDADGLSYYSSDDATVAKKLGYVPLRGDFDMIYEEDVISVSSSVGRTIRLKGAKPEITEEWALALEDLRDTNVQSKTSRKAAERQALQLAELMEQQAREAKLAPVVYRQGWLSKQGGSQKSAKAMMGFGKTWKRRWVVLNSYGVSYYETEEACASGAVELSFIPFDHNFAFTEVTKTAEESQFVLVSNSRQMALRAETKEEKWEWIQAMVAAKEGFNQVRPAIDQSQENFGVMDLKPQPQPIEDKLVSRNSIREGYLSLQKEVALNKTWKSRYFVLSAGELTYYKHPKDLTPLGTVALDANSVIQASKDQAFTFFVTASPSAKPLLVSAEGLQAQINWLDSFRHSVPNMFVSKGVASGNNASAGRSLLQVTRKSTRSLKEGFMLKQGHLNKTWKRRYFVLEAGSLEYYKNPQDKHPKGSIALGNEGDALTADTHVRCTLTCGGKSTNLSCESPLELLAWLTAFQSIKHLTVITNTDGKKQLRRAKEKP